jgi:predicted DNA-binding protein with PD1-like motif|tara:strand:+ start:174 stop:584 length:411 start_codon:yes stop_codon:yes gene_type:complete
LTQSQQWDATKSRILYHRFQPGESLLDALEELARSEGIREAIITSCIGSFTQLKLRNLCRRDEDGPVFERQTIDSNLELVSAEGYVQPLPERGPRVHIHTVAAHPSGEVVGGHCEGATIYTGAFMYLHVIEDEPQS